MYTPCHNIQTMVSPFLKNEEVEIFGREEEMDSLFNAFVKYRGKFLTYRTIVKTLAFAAFSRQLPRLITSGENK